MLGELLASQLQACINVNVLHTGETDVVSMSNNKAIGTWLLDNVFKPGAKYKWNDMIRRATGEELTARYYADQFLK
jgi:Zn-dependent M32 family carboxypeptidase